MKQKAREITADSDDVPWIITTSGDVMKYNEGEGWTNMDLPKAKKIVAGPAGSIYATAGPRNADDYFPFYRYSGSIWSLADEEGVKDFAIGKDGRVYKLNNDEEIYDGMPRKCTNNPTVT